MLPSPTHRVKARLWQFAANLTPVPLLARPKPAAAWQSMWRDRDDELVFRRYSEPSPLRDWLAQQILSLGPRSVVEFGCNVGANLEALWRADPTLALHGIELNERAAAWGRQNLGSRGCSASFVVASMADAAAALTRAGVSSADVVFTAAATMHVDDAVFAAARRDALKVARTAIVHLEFNAWTPADLQNGRNWRSSFFSDRWIRDYVAEYEGTPGVARIDCLRVPPAINAADSLGRLVVNDVTGLVIVHLEPPRH